MNSLPEQDGSICSTSTVSLDGVRSHSWLRHRKPTLTFYVVLSKRRQTTVSYICIFYKFDNNVYACLRTSPRLCLIIREDGLVKPKHVAECTPWENTRQKICEWHKTEGRSCNRCCSGKALIITYLPHVSISLFIQYAKRMRHIMLSSVACLAVQYFPHYLVNGTIFEKKKRYWT